MPFFYDVVQAEVINSAGNSVGNTVITVERTRGGVITPTTRISRPDTGTLVKYQPGKLSTNVNSSKPQSTITTIDVKVIENNTVTQSSGAVGRKVQLRGAPTTFYVEQALEEYKRALELEKQMETNPGMGLGRATKRERQKQDYYDGWRKVRDFLNPFRDRNSDREPQTNREPTPVRPRNPLPRIRLPWNQPRRPPVKAPKDWEDEKPVTDMPPAPNRQPKSEPDTVPRPQEDTDFEPLVRYLDRYRDCDVSIVFGAYLTQGFTWAPIPSGSYNEIQYITPPTAYAPPGVIIDPIPRYNTSTGQRIFGYASPQQYRGDGKTYAISTAPSEDNDYLARLHFISFSGKGEAVIAYLDDLASVQVNATNQDNGELVVSPGVWYVSLLVLECPMPRPPLALPSYDLLEDEMSCLALQLMPTLQRIEEYLAIVANGSIPSVCNPDDPNEGYQIEGKGLYGIASILTALAGQNVEIGSHVCDDFTVETEVVLLLDDAVDSQSIVLPDKTQAVRGEVILNGSSYKRFSRVDGVSNKYQLGFYSWETESGDRLPEQPIEWERCIFPVPQNIGVTRFYYWLPTATSFKFEAIKEVDNNATN